MLQVKQPLRIGLGGKARSFSLCVLMW